MFILGPLAVLPSEAPMLEHLIASSNRTARLGGVTFVAPKLGKLVPQLCDLRQQQSQLNKEVWSGQPEAARAGYREIPESL